MENRIIELTSALVAIPTHETEGEAQAYLAGVLSAAGFECELQDVEPNRPNLVARRGESGPFFCSHMDVHPPHAHPDPFTCRRLGDVLVGRGVLDAKGQIAALVAALEATPDADALVAICCDEEFDGLGSEQIRLPSGPWETEGGIVLEPTNFAICTAQAGQIDVRVEVSGTPTHAYATEQTGSPIKAVLAVIEELDTCRFLKTEHPLVGKPRVNVGRLSGGEHAWRTPARASLEMTLAVVPGTDIDEAVGEIRGRLDDVARRWGARGTSFLYDIPSTSPGIEVPTDLPIINRLVAATGDEVEPAGMPSWTDAANLLLRHNLPCIVFGAGDFASAHSDYESVAVADLARLAEVLRQLLVGQSA
ncbi:MAG: M20/M25/M40 family metallo-hydrolase [Actinomycetota bacterium]